MATKVGVTQRGAQKPDYGAANDAIDGILAKHSFDTKSRGLKRSYKQALKSYKQLSRREQAKGTRVEAMGTNLTGQSQSVEAQNKQATAAARQLEVLQGRWNEQANKLRKQWGLDFADDRRYTDLNKKQRAKAWKDYQERKARQMPIYQNQIKNQQQIANSLSSSAQAGYSQYKKGSAAYNAQRKALTAAGRRKMAAYERYEGAIRRYNRYNTYVPYRPA